MWRWLTLLAASLVALAPMETLAAEIRPGDTVVGPEQVVDDDLYVSGGIVGVQGTVRGDLVASGGTVLVTGTVTGDVLAAGGTVNVTGAVGETIRAAGGQVTIDGPVGHDVVVTGGTLTLGPNARVGRDLLAWGGTTAANGQVARNARVGGGDVTIGGTIGGDVHADTGNLRLTDTAVIGGNLVYQSDRQAQIAPGARVGGIQRVEPEPRPGPLATAAGLLLGWLRALFGLFVLGVLFVLLFPGFGRRAVNTLETSPWASLGLGFALLVVVPVAAILLFVIGVLIGGWWLVLGLLALYAMALPLGFVVSGLYVGRWTLEWVGRRGLGMVWALLAGLAVLTLIGLVPFLGAIVALAALLFGLGALALAAVRARRQAAPAPA